MKVLLNGLLQRVRGDPGLVVPKAPVEERQDLSHVPDYDLQRRNLSKTPLAIMRRHCSEPS